MDEPEYFLEIARQGSQYWNQGRLSYPDKAVNFSGVDFTLDENRGISFQGFEFGDNASFEGAIFGQGTDFRTAKFGQDTNFRRATFGDETNFGSATFSENTTFEKATFKGAVRFPKGDMLGSISFSGAHFCGVAIFAGRVFHGEVNFSDTTFDQPPDFRFIENSEHLDWTGVQFGFGSYPELGFVRIPVRWTTQSSTVARLRRLRGIAKEIHEIDAERDLFILGRQAERGVLWRNWWHGEWRTQFKIWWRPLTSTVLMFLYSTLSNCGRSFLLPIYWLAASNWGFYKLYTSLINDPICSSATEEIFDKALVDLTFSSAVPFGATARPVFQSALSKLFSKDCSNLVDIPWQIQTASAAHGVTNLMLLFLLGLALRNYFKFK